MCELLVPQFDVRIGVADEFCDRRASVISRNVGMQILPCHSAATSR